MTEEKVLKVLKEQLWTLGTFSDEPNAGPVFFKDVTEDGKLIVGDVFLAKTLDNIRKNGRITVSVFDAKTLEGYQIKGTATHIAEGPIVAMFNEKVTALFKGAYGAKGAIVIEPETVYVTTPGPASDTTLTL